MLYPTVFSYCTCAIVKTNKLTKMSNDTDIPGGHAFVSTPVVTRSRIPMSVLLRAYVGELIRSVVKQMTLRKERKVPLLFYEMKSLTF